MKNHTPNKVIVILLWTISLATIGILLLQTYLERVQETPLQIQFEISQNSSHKETLTPNQFKERFNSASNKFDSHIRVESLNIQTGLHQDTFNFRLQKHINLLGILDESGIIRSATIIGLGDGSLGDDTDTIMAIAILIAAFNPDLPIMDCYQIIKDTDPKQHRQAVKRSVMGNDILMPVQQMAK